MRKRGYGSLIWGGLLIIIGLLFLVDNLDLLGDWNVPIWSLILGAISLTFLLVYLNDREQWWALIPGLVILGIAVAVFMAEQDLIAGYLVATIILAGVGLPFLLIFITDRRHWWALIPGMTMSGVAAAVLMEGVGLISGAAVAGVIFGGIALGFASIYIMDRDQWWALFPGGATAMMAFILLMASFAEYVWPLALILLGLLLLRANVGGRRRRPKRKPTPSQPAPSIDAAKATGARRQRLPTLEEQIEEAIAAETVEEAEVVDETPPETPEADEPETEDKA